MTSATMQPTKTPPAETADAPLMLSVSGARGIVGATMTPQVAATFAAAYGSHVRKLTGKKHPVMCVGRDTRPSGDMLARAVVAGLSGVGCRVIELGVVATPSVGVAIGAHKADGGMVVTASHNPTPWNGLKCLDSSGVAPAPEIANAIIERFENENIDHVGATEIQPIETDETTNDTHIARVLEHVDPDPIRGAWIKVVLDSGNGAGCVSGKMLLDTLRCDVVHMHGEPTGAFERGPEPVKDNLVGLAEKTRETGAAVGFAQDPDADRLAIVDEQGNYIGEEYTLALAAKYLLDAGGEGVLAANLSTSRMIDDLAAAKGAKVLRTAVGEANVAAAMQSSGNPLVGGEGNGGVIFPKVCWVRDSLSAMALVLSLLAKENRPLSAIVEDLPKYAMIKKKVDLADVGGRAAIAPAIEAITHGYPDAEVNTSDGVRIDFADGWVHVRPSNTEPIMRIIAEAESEVRATTLIQDAMAKAGLG